MTSQGQPTTDGRHERGESTRRALIAAARELFAADGYAAVSTEDIVDAADVTRGALYYHFGDKKALFAAVYEHIEAELVGGAGEAAGAVSEPWEQLGVGLRAFLDACTAPDVFQICLVDAPSVLGWQQRRETGTKYGVRQLRTLLERGIATGALREHDVETHAHLISALLGEAALMLANAPDRGATRARIETAVVELVRGLRAR